MRKMLRITLFVFLFGVVCVAAYSQPKIPKRDIPADIPPYVRKQIERLYSSDAVERGEAAYNLGRMDKKAIPAVPFLIGMLDDTVGLKWIITGKYISPSKVAAKALAKIGNPAVEPLIAALKDEKFGVRERAAGALEKITEMDFGQDQTEWQNWWDKMGG